MQKNANFNLSNNLLEWKSNDSSLELDLGGNWVLSNYNALQKTLGDFQRKTANTPITKVNAGKLENLDTVGAQLLVNMLGSNNIDLVISQISGLSSERTEMLKAVAKALSDEEPLPKPEQASPVLEFLSDIGSAVARFYQQFMALMGFSGLTLQSIFANLLRPSQWRLTPIVAQIHQTGFNALPIIALLTFLVGAVVAFLGATILKDFGATTFTVNLVGFSFLREFAVLLTAILMAGRTASSFTAQIGSMKINEEIDAIKVQGLDPINMLVLPRVIALQISLPVLTFVGMISGIVGGMAVCAFSLGISPDRFLVLFVEMVPVRHFVLGMAKAPVFAFLIAVIGCQQGFKVSGSAQSVGERTTSSVVHSIFVVIVLDALAALFYMEMGW